MRRIEALGKISDEPGRLTRTFCSPSMRRANDVVAKWMRQAGMAVREDAIGNLIGHYPAQLQKSKIKNQKPKILLLGSHLDTVRDAGKFDGPLGVLVAIACVQQLHDSKTRLPFAIEVVGFADEEGVRYQSTYLGSKAMAGTFNRRDLERKDANGLMMSEAIRKFGGQPSALATAKMDPKRLLGYVEVHIEQGPVLEAQDLSVGLVTGISGQTRGSVTFKGQAGHAGTTPMALRRDAFCAASEFVLAVEYFARAHKGLVATVGEAVVSPGAGNVIPGEVRLSLDVRHADDHLRKTAVASLYKQAVQIAKRRNLKVNTTTVHQAPAVACDRQLSSTLSASVKQCQGRLLSLPSGAGHDAAAMAAITPIAMLFVRCKGGVSHHPAESAAEKDVTLAIDVMSDFLTRLSRSATTSISPIDTNSRVMDANFR
jgi:allantoate deiminase